MRRGWTYVVGLLAMMCNSWALSGQDFPSLHYSVEDGLPSNTVYQVYRDSKGYLWIATDKGIARYNGVKFEKFTTFDGLSDNEVFSFQEDYYGRMWFATYNGSLCYYQDGVFHSDANTPFLKLPFRTSFIQHFNINKDSSITVNFYDCSILLTIGRNSLVQHVFKDLRKDLFVSYILDKRKISADSYLFTADSGDIIVDTGYKVRAMRKRSDNFFLKKTMSQNKAYFFNRDFVYNEEREKIRPLKKGLFDKNFIHIYFTDGKNWFWGTTSGLFINDSIQILNGCDVTSATRDNAGNYWITTLNSGIYAIKKDFMNTRILEHAYPGMVKYCYEDAQHLFFSVNNNNLYSFENGQINCVFDYGIFKNKKYSFPSDAGFLVEKDNSNYTYYSYYNEDNIIIRNVLSANRTIRRDSNDFSGLGPKGLFRMDGELFIKGRDRIVSIADPALMPGNVIKQTFAPNTAAGYRIFGTGKSGDSAIYYSTVNNVYKIEKGVSTRESQFMNLAFKTLGIFGKYLVGVTHDNKLVICNNFRGNMMADSVTNQDCVWLKLYKLDSGRVLVSTNNLYRVITLFPSADKPDYKILTVENPFIPLNAEMITSDGANCYFFKNGSITSLGINSILVAASPPELGFTFLKTNRKTYIIDSLIEIPFKESKNIIVNFSTLSFSGKNVEYEYSVSKSETDNWRDLRGEEINLFNSGYGTYVIKIKAKTISSGFSAPIVFTLNVLPPFWTTWWFTALVIGAVLGLLLFINSIRTRVLLRRKERDHQTEIRFMRSEYKALNALMNPHFIFNTLNNVQGLVNRNDKLAANEYLRVFADLVRQNMSNISKELIPLQKEIDLVNNYLTLEQLRFKELLNYQINVDDQVDLSEIMISPLLVQPLVENSIKHGILPLESPEGMVCVNIYKRNERLYIEVRDNGVGMAQSQNKNGADHESFGLENIKTRIAQLSLIQNKEITFHTGEERDGGGLLLWTVVTISMPVPE